MLSNKFMYNKRKIKSFDVYVMNRFSHCCHTDSHISYFDH